MAGFWVSGSHVVVDEATSPEKSMLYVTLDS